MHSGLMPAPYAGMTYPGAAFGPEGTPVYVVREWAPGVEMVQEVPGGYGAPYHTGVRVRARMKTVMLAGGVPLQAEQAQMMMQQQQAAAAAASASPAHAPRSAAALLLLG